MSSIVITKDDLTKVLLEFGGFPGEREEFEAIDRVWESLQKIGVEDAESELD